MTAVDEAPAIASPKARAKIVLTLAELGIRDEEEQRNVIERTTRGRTRRRSELRPDEASWLIKRLETITPAELAAIARPAANRPRVEKEPAPQQRALDAAACLASWDAPADAPAVDPDVDDEPPEPAEDEPEGDREERRRPDPVAIAAETAVAPLLAADAIEPARPVEPAPAREPGWNPAWPHPAAEGWTGPTMVNGLPNPSGLGPYCMGPPGTCLCGGCPHYVPLPPVDSKEYRDQVRNALRKASEKNDRKKGGR